MNVMTITLSVAMDAAQYARLSLDMNAVKMLVVCQFVELFEVMEGRQQKTVMMETQMTTMDDHLHE